MALRTNPVSLGEVTVARGPLPLWTNRAWRAALVILLGFALWLGLRWGASASRPLEPSLGSFMADGGGGAIDVQGIYAPENYFRLTKRDPAALGMDPSRELIFFVLIDTHERDEELPSPTTWWDAVSLKIDGEGDYRPWKQKLVMSSEHHQTVALAFPRNGDLEKGFGAGDKSVLGLLVPDLANGGARAMEWHLPLSKATAPLSPTGGSLPLSLGALLPLLAGLLVAFSPCAVHMTTYYLPLLGGASSPGTKGRLALVSGLFTLGFAIPYTVAGVVVGYAGQFTKTSPFLGGISQPLTIVAGAVVLYLGLQLIGILRLPFFLRLNLPTLRPGWSRTGHFASGFLGLNLAVGCLGCVGGSLFAALLLYSGAVGSPVEGGAILFLFAVAANVPPFLAAITMGRFQLSGRLPLSITRYAPVASGAMLIALALLILSGTESLMEDALIQALGIQG